MSSPFLRTIQTSSLSHEIIINIWSSGSLSSIQPAPSSTVVCNVIVDESYNTQTKISGEQAGKKWVRYFECSLTFLIDRHFKYICFKHFFLMEISCHFVVHSPILNWERKKMYFACELIYQQMMKMGKFNDIEILRKKKISRMVRTRLSTSQ